MPRRVIKKLSPLGRRSRFDRFDPNAVDGDNDGIVQELTRFERPSVPSGVKPSSLMGSMGRVRTEAVKERDARIVDKWKNGESIKNIANTENVSEATVSWAVNQARKRGEITEPRRARSNIPYSASEPPSRINTNIQIEIDDSDKEILDAYDSGKSVNQIARDKNVKAGDILKSLARYRLPDEDGKFSIPRKKPAKDKAGKRKMTGSMSVRLSPEKLKTIDEYIKDNPTESNRSIANRFEVSPRTISQRRKSLGIEANPVINIPSEKIAEIDEYIKNNSRETNRLIADKFEVSPNTVAARRKFLGLGRSIQGVKLSPEKQGLIEEILTNNPQFTNSQVAALADVTVTPVEKIRRTLGLQSELEEQNFVMRTSQETIDAIDEDIKKHPKTPTSEIAKRNGVSDSVVASRRIFLNIPSPWTGGGKRFSDETYMAIDEDIKKNPKQTNREIAERHGVSADSILKRRRALNILVNPTEQDKKRKRGQYSSARPIPDSVKDEIVELYLNSELPIRQIAKKLQVNELSIFRVVEERGVKRRRGKGYSKQKYKKPKTSPSSLSIETDKIAEEIGFFKPSENGYSWRNHPQFQYELETGKPVTIKVGRIETNTDSVTDGERYTGGLRGIGNYGPAMNFYFEGDVITADVYAGFYTYGDRSDLEEVRELAAEVELKNPFVYNAGIIDIPEETIGDLNSITKPGTPRRRRLATQAEIAKDIAAQLGGNQKVKSLAKKALRDIEEKPLKERSESITVRGQEEEISPEELYKIENDFRIIMDDIASGRATLADIAEKESREKFYRLINSLVRENGHDGIVRLALGEFGADGSQIQAFNRDGVKVSGARKPFSNEWLDARFDAQRTNRRLSGSIRGTEPEVWQRQSSRGRPLVYGDELYDEAFGPTPRNPRVGADTRPIKKENAQDIIVDIAQEIAIAKRQKTPPSLTGPRNNKPYKKNKTNRVVGLSKTQRAEYIKQRNELIQEELEKGELSIDELADIFNISKNRILQFAGKPGRKNTASRKKTEKEDLEKQVIGYIKKEKPTTTLSNLVKNTAAKYELAISQVKKTFKKELKDFENKRNKAIREDLKNATELGPILSKYSINRPALAKIAGDIIKDRNFQAEARAGIQNRVARRIKKPLPPGVTPEFLPESSRENNNTIDLTQPMPNRSLRGRGNQRNQLSGSMSGDRLSPVRTAGILSGMMSNENPSVNKKIEVKSDVKKEGSKILANVQYGDIELSFDFEDGKYFEWTDAYDMWAGWRGNYAMRLASAALMGEPLPKAFGYTGDELGTHHHDLLGNGVSPDISRSEIIEMTDSVRSAFIGLDFIHQGSEISTDIEYRGLSGIDSSDEIMTARNGDSIVLPLSAFTSDITTALSYSSNQFDETGEEFILAIEPGAKIANAAGEQYQHEFLKNGKWVIDVTEQVTQGRFLVKSIRTSLVRENGKQRKIKIVNLQQSETFNPRTGKWEKISGFKPNLSGNMSSSEARKDTKLKELADNTELVKGLIPGSAEQMREMLVDRFLTRNQGYAKQDRDIQESKPWNSDNPPLNPDGSRMSEKQYMDFVKATRAGEAAEFLSQRLNPYNPDFTPNHIRQLSHNVSLALTASPGLKQLLDEYGYPVFGIFQSQQVDGKFIPNEEAFKLPEIKAARGITIMQLGVAAVLPRGREDFIQSDNVNSIPTDNTTRFDGHWGINPSVYISDWDGEGEFRPFYEDAKRIADVSQAAQGRVFFVDSGLPFSVIKHETMHSVHYGALVSALRKYLQNPSDRDAEDAYKFLAALVKVGGWQAVPDYLRKMMIDNAVSSYALTSPMEWFAETLSASMSPHDFTRKMVTPEARAFLATVLPEMADYFMKGKWG